MTHVIPLFIMEIIMNAAEFVGKELVFRGQWAIVESAVDVPDGVVILTIMDQEGNTFDVESSVVDFVTI